MNRPLFTLIPLAAAVLYTAPFATHAQAAQVAAAATMRHAECAGAAPLSYVQGRIVEKAVQGTVALRQFVWRTRMIHQLDLMESVAWLDQRRALLAACERCPASIDPDAAARRRGQHGRHDPGVPRPHRHVRSGQAARTHDGEGHEIAPGWLGDLERPLERREWIACAG